MAITPQQRKAMQQRMLAAQEQIDRQSRGARPLPDVPPIGAYAEDYHELLEYLLNNPDVDPTNEPWWEPED